MDVLKDRRVIVVAGAVIALVIALLIVVKLLHTKPSTAPPPGSQAAIIIGQGRPDDSKLDPKRELGCFVGGQYIGLATWADCAKRNGVATGDLDVGLDAQGGLVAAPANSGGADIVPLPPNANNTAPKGTPPPAAPPAPVEAAPAPQAAATATPKGPVATCWRYDHTWYRMSDMSQAACVQTLFAGRCEKPGSATYGRWGEQTLRLLPGRVEASDDNHSFHTVVEQNANCSIPSP